jgi:hypothetical protein
VEVLADADQLEFGGQGRRGQGRNSVVKACAGSKAAVRMPFSLIQSA